ncbi:hypothetical protein V1478_002556 [Vespula squamosa]|uniref:Uncharacterized protein n=1 Tax=Vespula squamosa TaxID=30214 RepID=A0ABD2BSW4_VESSQ
MENEIEREKRRSRRRRKKKESKVRPADNEETVKLLEQTRKERDCGRLKKEEGWSMGGCRRGKRKEFEPDALLSTSNIHEERYFETFLGVTLEDSASIKAR